MITAVDSNVLIDVVGTNAAHREESEARLLGAAATGALVLSEPVLCEVAIHFSRSGDLERFLADIGAALVPSTVESLHAAGVAWTQHVRRRPRRVICAACGAANEVRCSRCGATIGMRQHIAADFIIGAHAVVHADQMLTRDRGYYKTYFPALKLL